TNVFLTKDFTALAESDTPWELPDAKRKELWTSFCVGVNEKDFEPTLRLLDRYLREEQAMTHERFVAWHNAVILWHRLAYRWFLSDPDTLTALEDFFEKAHLTVADAEKNSHARIQLQFKQREFMIILFSSYFTPISDLEHFVTYIAGQLPNFGVMGAYVAMFTEDDYSKARLLMYFTPQGETYSDPTGITVDSPELLPEQVNPGDHYNLIVEPLLNYDNIIGYLILQVKGPLDFIENIRQILSNGLISIILVQEVMKDKQLKDLLIDLQEKQQELQKAYTTLKENQSTMLVIEKMASLGRMTAGIAHEMNTPIATIRTALTELSQLIDEYDASIGDGEVTPADHREIAAEMRKSLVLADKASEKAAGFVRGIKAQTRDLDPKDRITFNAVTIIREALQLLEHRLKYGRTEAVFEPDRDDIKLFGVPGRLAQIITNLVNNAIDACADVSRGMVHLTLTLDGNETILTVSDNGAGIAPEHLTRIFDPMFTTKPFSVGTGLGLTLVHDIITADFGGKIDVASSPGKGTTFTIRFPDSEAQGAVNGQEIQS
ncbi:MAG TPA: GHKL domain-containing protein, partial [Spirochaetia bacterium]|nr:GHKL domain-containing protein [Spirochaetia bacterium]